MEYEVTISAYVRDAEGRSNFTMYETQKIELKNFAELDELMARMRNAIQPENKGD